MLRKIKRSWLLELELSLFEDKLPLNLTSRILSEYCGVSVILSQVVTEVFDVAKSEQSLYLH